MWLWAITDLQRFVLFAVLGAMVLPEALLHPGGTQVALADVLLIVALAAWLIVRAAGADTSTRLPRSGLLVACLLFVGVNVESLAWSDDPRATIQFAIQLFEIVVVFTLVFATLPRSLDVIQRGLAVFVAVTCVLAGVYMAGAADQIPGAPGKNTIGSFVAAGLVMAYALMLSKRGIGLQRMLLLAVVIDVAGLIDTASRGSVIGAVTALVVMSLLLRRHRLMTVGIVVVMGVGFLAIHGTDTRDKFDRNIKGSYNTSTVRVYSFRDAKRKIRQEPFLGSGAGTYTDYIPELEITLPDPNNMFLLTWAEVGIGGLLALLFLLWRYTRLMFAVRNLPEREAAIAVGAGCVALSLLVHFQFDVTWTRGTTSLAFATMGLMLAVQRLAGATADERGLDLASPARAVGTRTLPRIAHRAG
ncbi:MAG: O-Antigen ligase [Solirubrobacteraceae bacterium]|nr:O-Antigen ligase [Solirubrobacteraceae bacterium]